MAQLGRLEITVTDTAGNASVGASVQVYVQGASVKTVNSATSFDTYDVGGLVNGETVQINTASGTTRAITALTATNVQVGAGGFTGVNPFDRIVQITTPPTLYKEATGTVTIANPLTTDSNGYASCWLPIGRYDLVVSGGTPNITQRVITDYEVGAGENFRSTIFDGASAVGWIFDTLRSITTAGAKLLSIRTGGSEKFSVDRQGGFTAAQASTVSAGGLTVSAGGLTVSAGGLAVTGNSTIAGTLGSVTNLTLTGSVSGGTTVSGSGDFTMRRLIAGQGNNVVAGDFSLHANWGAGASIASVSGKDSAGFINVLAGAGTGPNPTVTFTFHDGAYVTAPTVVVSRCDGNAPKTDFISLAGKPTTTQAIFVYSGTPTAASNYQMNWITVGY